MGGQPFLKVDCLGAARHGLAKSFALQPGGGWLEGLGARGKRIRTEANQGCHNLAFLSRDYALGLRQDLSLTLQCPDLNAGFVSEAFHLCDQLGAQKGLVVGEGDAVIEGAQALSESLGLGHGFGSARAASIIFAHTSPSM